MDMANLLACHVESHIRRFEAATSRSHQDVVLICDLRHGRSVHGGTATGGSPLQADLRF
jgi:hypothetical protein